MSPTAPRKTDLVAQALMGEIVSGALDPGGLLPKEDELAQRFWVTRGVVREAIKLLEVHHLVRPVRRRGTEILDPLRSLSPAVLSTMLQSAPGSVDSEVLANLLEIRAMVDAEMAGLAARRREEEDLEALRQSVDALAASRRDAERYSSAVDHLALCIARASHNRIFEMMVHWHERIRGEVGALTAISRQPSEPHLQGARALVKFIEAGDEESARRLVSAYHAWINPRILAIAALQSGANPETLS